MFAEINNKSQFNTLSESDLKTIYQRALNILEKTGVKFHCRQALDILHDTSRVEVDYSKQTARFSPAVVQDSIEKAPERIKMYNREGEEALTVGGEEVNFVPGSAALKILTSRGGNVREAGSKDLEKISVVTDALKNIKLQSTSVVLKDVPEVISDFSRLYILLHNSDKPIVTGAFSRQGITNMQKILQAAADGEEELRNKPLAIFDICASPPLKWSEISCYNIIDCARYGLPLELISLPMPGVASPVTLAGSVLFHTVEVLSGLVLAQTVNPGLPVIYGGAPVNFDMKTGTTPMSAVEAAMIGASTAQMGKYFSLPTHTFACLSDAKLVDMQAGLETSMSGTIALLSGVNIIAGPGILDDVNCFSLEKLVIDNDICGMALRLKRGVEVSEEKLAENLIAEKGPGGEDYLTDEHTLRWYQEESYYPSEVIDRKTRDTWEKSGKKDIYERASDKVENILAGHDPSEINQQKQEQLAETLQKIKREMDINQELVIE